jgi:hypothetical protein
VDYVTLAENAGARVSGPVSLFIIRIEKAPVSRRVKTILSDNVFEEKITRATADFGANGGGHCSFNGSIGRRMAGARRCHPMPPGSCSVDQK